MKIRILNNSLRIRVSQSELKNLSEGNAITSLTSFPISQLKIAVIPIEGPEIKIDFSNHSIFIDIPISSLRDLNDTDRVGLETNIKTQKEDLAFLFEKDFKCLTERKEDESDLYANPNKSH